MEKRTCISHRNRVLILQAIVDDSFDMIEAPDGLGYRFKES
jgi:hypothetical protein